MKKTLLSIFTLSVAALCANAQMYTPAASVLQEGTLNQVYAGQTINFTVPTTGSVSGTVVEDALLAAYPAAAAVVPLLGLGSQNFDVAVSSTTLSVSGSPTGITASCDATPCTYAAGTSGTITFAGTPTVSGSFTVDITSMTSGDVDISALASQLSALGVPSTIALTQPAPNILDETGYTIFVADPNGIEESNEVFSLGFYPNPTEGAATLDVTSTVAGMAIIEVYSITGSLVQTYAEAIRTGANRINLDLSSVPAGIYLIKANINGSQALIRMQKS